jgi:branched-chain amino acid transport system substrate-binding protein
MGSLAKLSTVCAVVSMTVPIASCGGGRANDGTTVRGGHENGRSAIVDIYSSLPLHGPTRGQTIAMINGIKLALSQAGDRAGRFTVRYRSLDDSSAATGQWDPSATAANAGRAAADRNTVYYIGEADSQASEVSIPILNQAGIPQLSPANTYVGLTRSILGVTAAGEPAKYYPTGSRSYLRIVPNDTVQAAADLEAMKQAGCAKVALANDGESYGAGLATLLELEKRLYGVNIVSNTVINPKASNHRSYGSAVKAQGANCFVFTGIPSNGGVQIAKDVHAALPTAKLFAPDRMCTPSWTSEKSGGVPASIDPYIACTRPTLGLSAYPRARQFLAAYQRMYHVSNPDPYALYGYEAMKLGLDTISNLGPNGNDKSAVLRALFAIRNRNSVLGTYGFGASGDTTLRTYGLYKVGPNGDPVFDKTLSPARVL